MYLRMTKTTQKDPCYVCTSLRMAGHAWSHATKSISPKCYFSLINIFPQTITEIDALFPQILMIKQSSNLIGHEHFGLQLVIQNFSRYGVCTRKTSFILGYFRQNTYTYMYELTSLITSYLNNNIKDKFTDFTNR